MDLDFEDDDLGFGEDKIKIFLQDKLQEIEVYNAKTKGLIAEKKQSRQDEATIKNLDMDDGTVQVSLAWKKMFGSKFVLAYCIKSDNDRPLDKFSVLLRWNSSTPLTYKTLLCQETLRQNISTTMCNANNCPKIINNVWKSPVVESKGILMVVLNFPEFIDQLDYQIQGNIICNQGDKVNNLSLPYLKISIHDATDRTLNDWSLAVETAENLLTIISSSQSTELLLILPEDWKRNLNSTFEIHCSLTISNLSVSCKKYFFASGVSPLLDGSLLEIHIPGNENDGLLFSTMYTRDDASLLAFLHHIHKYVPGIIIIPPTLYQNYQNVNGRRQSFGDQIEKFKNSISQEFRFVQNFLLKSQSDGCFDKDSVIKFRSRLAELEKDTDLLYLNISKEK